MNSVLFGGLWNWTLRRTMTPSVRMEEWGNCFDLLFKGALQRDIEMVNADCYLAAGVDLLDEHRKGWLGDRVHEWNVATGYNDTITDEVTPGDEPLLDEEGNSIRILFYFTSAHDVVQYCIIVAAKRNGCVLMRDLVLCTYVTMAHCRYSRWMSEHMSPCAMGVIATPAFTFTPTIICERECSCSLQQFRQCNCVCFLPVNACFDCSWSFSSQLRLGSVSPHETE